MPRRYRSGTITAHVEVDICDMLEEVDTEYLLNELHNRDDGPLGKSISGFTQPGVDLLNEVRRELLNGKPNAALALVEQILAKPKANILDVYNKALGARDTETGRPLIA